MILIQAHQIILRDSIPEDIDHILRWQTTGEWRLLDAPWEGILESMSAEKEAAFREHFLEAQQKERESPRRSAVIALTNENPIGFINRYGNDRFPDIFYLGINICADRYLDQGLGTIALTAWADYLFGNSQAHKLEVHTWSFNPRMIRVAEKCGFQPEGTERELIEWGGERLDRVRHGLLRQEWANAKEIPA